MLRAEQNSSYQELSIKNDTSNVAFFKTTKNGVDMDLSMNSDHSE